LTHKEILKEVWGDAYVQESQYLRVHIGNIRSKINFLEKINFGHVSKLFEEIRFLCSKRL
jgi:DNA-binding response OmpR family regulator